MSTSGLGSYRAVKNYGNLADANPHQVVHLMLDTLLTRILEARGHLERGETAAKGEKIGKALAITEGLLLSLDLERGGELAENLQRLYDYSMRTLLKANVENRVEPLDEVAGLVREIKAGWDAIPERIAVGG